MGGRNHVPPPDAALAPNTAPGRVFWDKVHADDDEDAHQVIPPTPVALDVSKPNLTRLDLADTLFAQNIAAGQDSETARANADARALQMIP
jgi:hypothetical protein